MSEQEIPDLESIKETQKIFIELCVIDKTVFINTILPWFQEIMSEYCNLAEDIHFVVTLTQGKFIKVRIGKRIFVIKIKTERKQMYRNPCLEVEIDNLERYVAHRQHALGAYATELGGICVDFKARLRRLESIYYFFENRRDRIEIEEYIDDLKTSAKNLDIKIPRNLSMHLDEKYFEIQSSVDANICSQFHNIKQIIKDNNLEDHKRKEKTNED